MTPEDAQSIAQTIKIMSELTSSEPNEWLPVYAALGGAVAGALASLLPSWLIERRREVAFSRQIERCLLAEISAIVEIIDQRGYQSTLNEIIVHLRQSPKEAQYSFYVDVPPHYSRVYQENCKHIGVVREEVAQKIIAFHQLIDAIVQDLKPSGIFSEGATLAHFEEMGVIFSKAINIARSITSRNEKQPEASQQLA